VWRPRGRQSSFRFDARAPGKDTEPLCFPRGKARRPNPVIVSCNCLFLKQFNLVGRFGNGGTDAWLMVGLETGRRLSYTVRMAKVLHLTRDDYRAWRTNHYVLVDEQEHIVRPATRGEVTAYETARNLHRLLKIKVDGKVCSFIQSRELQKRAWFETWGDCIIKASNGRFLCAVRDPRIARPTFQMSTTGRSGPTPIECECRGWGDPHPGRHHPMCNWNKYAPKTEKADPRKAPTSSVVVVDAAEVPDVPEPETGSDVAWQTAARTRAPDPSSCVCREWPWYGSDSRGHNRYCQYHAQWLEENPLDPLSSPEPTNEEVIDESEARERTIPTPAELQVQASGSAAEATADREVPLADRQVPPKKIPTPEECICRTWERKDGSTVEDGHNSICQFHDAWLLQQEGLTKHYIYEFTGDRPIELREATYEEINEARINEGSTGNSIIHIGEHNDPYLVATRQEVATSDDDDFDEDKAVERDIIEDDERRQEEEAIDRQVEEEAIDRQTESTETAG
jgi:hypothetical protein